MILVSNYMFLNLKKSSMQLKTFKLIAFISKYHTDTCTQYIWGSTHKILCGTTGTFRVKMVILTVLNRIVEFFMSENI